MFQLIQNVCVLVFLAKVKKHVRFCNQESSPSDNFTDEEDHPAQEKHTSMYNFAIVNLVWILTILSK